MLREKLDENDLAFVEVLEDPIWCVEFLRTTKDGSPQKEHWAREEFTYRHYQRALISDRSEKIAVLGGRAIGKCQPQAATIYTTQGYQSIYHLRRKKVFEVYCLDNDGRLTTRRAVLQRDKNTRTYTIRTESGYVTHATDIHPFLTPDGYVPLSELQAGDLVAVNTHLPWSSQQKLWRWHELRYMGYMLLNPTWRSEIVFKPRFERIKEELKHIAHLAGLKFADYGDGCAITRKGIYERSLMRRMADELDFQSAQQNASLKSWDGRIIPETLKQECLEHLKIFIEALFAQHATLQRTRITIDCISEKVPADLQEILLRFGIESTVQDTILTLRDERAIYRFYTTFDLPGVRVENIKMPPASHDAAPVYRYEPITSIVEKAASEFTYALYVHDFHNYITGNIHTHNSLFLEDRFVYRTLNQDLCFPQTKEMLLATQNQAQLDPIQGRLITRFTSSRLLKDFLSGRVNKTAGVFDFRFGDTQFMIRTRIAGNDGKQNMIGLHLPDMSIDEAQIFGIQAWNELQPAYNSWEKEKQIVVMGVSNGLRNSLLYHADKKLSGFKRYLIPAHNNPYYSRQDDIDNLKRLGGEESDEYQQQVLGRHGTAAFAVLNRDQIKTESLDIYRYRYTGNEIQRNIPYQTHLERVAFPNYDFVVCGIDCGFVDPTIISIIGYKNGTWYMLARYIFHRVDFATQEKIIDWLDQFYHFQVIGIDIGSGGGGTQMLHSFLYRQEYSAQNYEGRIIPVQFGEKVAVGYDSEGKELTQTTKTLGASLLVQNIQAHQLVFSEHDHEAISQLERITKQKSINGDDRYFILSEKGNGASPDDHLFASLICWAIATRDMSFQKRKRKKLGKSSGKSS